MAIIATDDSFDGEDHIPGPPTGHRRTATESSLDVSSTQHHIRGMGILASKKDLSLPAAEFAAGCNLLQAAARGDLPELKNLLHKNPHHINFRDYDRRTALHVAASEGHMAVTKYLVENGAMVNRSDRWGGSPLDDAHRHQQREVVLYLREHGATTGNHSTAVNFITAAAQGDVNEVCLLIPVVSDINEGDYDQRTALHLAAGEGHDEIVQILCEGGANPNAADRWGGKPLDDAERNNHEKCAEILKSFGATAGTPNPGSNSRANSIHDNPDESYLKVEFSELDIIERIGAGAFGEIYKCKWRGTLVAAKIIKSAKIRKEWLAKHAMGKLSTQGSQGSEVDAALQILDELELSADDLASDSAIEDFRKEISVLKSLRYVVGVLWLLFLSF